MFKKECGSGLTQIWIRIQHFSSIRIQAKTTILRTNFSKSKLKVKRQRWEKIFYKYGIVYTLHISYLSIIKMNKFYNKYRYICFFVFFLISLKSRSNTDLHPDIFKTRVCGLESSLNDFSGSRLTIRIPDLWRKNFFANFCGFFLSKSYKLPVHTIVIFVF
jgi:hypothetical protein